MQVQKLEERMSATVPKMILTLPKVPWKLPSSAGSKVPLPNNRGQMFKIPR